MKSSGPGYTVKDLVFYGMMILGIVLTYKLFEEFAPTVHRLLRFIVSLVVGGGVGWLALKLYEGGGQSEN